jgi:hypothetical protein
MEGRGMTLRYIIGALLLIVLVAAGVFRLKYAVVDVERQFTDLQHQIEEERWQLRLRQADLAYLTRPDRLVGQADQLHLRPARSGQIVELASIGSRAQIELARNPLAIMLPSGAEGALRAKPIVDRGGWSVPSR